MPPPCLSQAKASGLLLILATRPIRWPPSSFESGRSTARQGGPAASRKARSPIPRLARRCKGQRCGRQFGRGHAGHFERLAFKVAKADHFVTSRNRYSFALWLESLPVETRFSTPSNSSFLNHVETFRKSSSIRAPASRHDKKNVPWPAAICNSAHNATNRCTFDR